MGTIDIAKLLKEGDNKTLKSLPGFLINGLKIIIRERSLNRILEKYKNLEGKDFEDKIIEELKLKIAIKGIDHLPGNGRCIFTSNHPFGVVDGLLLTHTVASKYGQIKAIGNDAFYLLPQLRPFIFSVNVYGINTKDRIAELDNLYASDFPVTHFPAGEVSRRYNGKIQDCDWQKSFIVKAIAHQRDIVPFFFKGRNSRLFYFVHLVRSFLGVKTILELALLPREIFNKKNRKIELYIGKPISYSLFTNKFSAKEWTRLIREYTYQLEKEIDTSFEDWLHKINQNK